MTEEFYDPKVRTVRQYTVAWRESKTGLLNNIYMCAVNEKKKHI